MTKIENGAKLYRRIKIAGLISFIPFVLAAGPVSGYFLGSFLEFKFGLRRYVVFIFVLAGLAAAVFETIKILRLVVKIEKKD